MKNEKKATIVTAKKNDLSDRLLNFAAHVIKYVGKLGNSYASQHISKQLIRSSTSMGANYEEACNAESRADFIHKMQLVLKESQESNYWLKLISKADLVKTVADEYKHLVKEAIEINKIIAKSVITAKQSR